MGEEVGKGERRISHNEEPYSLYLSSDLVSTAIDLSIL
jgi:hypothetical protein